jgi:hypothetical protein
MLERILKTIDNLKQREQEQDDAFKKWQQTQVALKEAYKNMDSLVQEIKKSHMHPDVIDVQGNLFLVKTGSGRNDSLVPLKIVKIEEPEQEVKVEEQEIKIEEQEIKIEEAK